MEINVVGISLNVINCTILVFNFLSVGYSSRKIYVLHPKSFDYNFYILMFMWGSYSFISNLMALYRGCQTFVLERVGDIPVDLVWATYVDRSSQLGMAFTGYLLCRKYLIEWFLWMNKQK